MKVPSFQPKNNLLKDKRILITGAGSGIGRQVSLDAAKMGADLILLSKDISKLYSLQDEILEKELSEPLIVELDFHKAKEKDYKTLAENLYENYGELNGLVHIAGILGYLSPLMHTSLMQLKTVMQINFESNFLITLTPDVVIDKKLILKIETLLSKFKKFYLMAPEYRNQKVYQNF